ncbi:MAG: LacI family DNA-binding transcriptional regulator [Bacteroidota bacterium]
MKKKVTIHDLARILNIDSSTVSRALNDSSRVGVITKKKVLDLAKELGYQRNLLASNLRTNKTMTIGVVVPFISRHFFSEAIDGIEQAAADKNYRVIIAQSNDDFEKEKHIIEGMFMSRIDGLLLSPTLGTPSGEHLNIFLDNEIPVVLFDRYYENARINKVIIEDRNAAFTITEHLIKNGFKNLIHLTGNQDAVIYKKRLQGFKEAITKYNLPFKEEMVHSIPLLPDQAINFIEKLVESSDPLPDGIVCANDVTALAIMKYLDANTDVKVPEDMAITGFSNEPASSIIKPELTTVDQHSYEMGRKAARMLLDSIESNDDYLSRQTVVVRTRLIVRGSSVKSSKSEASLDKFAVKEIF